MLKTNEVRIETCTHCNQNCVFCPHNTFLFKRKRQVMSLKDYKFYVDKLNEEATYITDIAISGFGESLLDSTILDKIEYSRNKGYNIHFLTNGTMLSRKTINDLLGLGIEDIRISLHAIDTYANLMTMKRSEALHLNVLDNIEYIIKNKGRTRLIITTQVVEYNKHEVRRIIDKYSKRVDSLVIWRPHNWTNDMSFKEGEIVRDTCGRPWSGPLQIQVDGTINMCCFDYNGKLLLGDFRTQSLEEIFNSEKFLYLKHHHKEGTLNKTDLICKDCDQRKDVSGSLVYSSLFTEEERLFTTSTNYSKIERK